MEGERPGESEYQSLDYEEELARVREYMRHCLRL